MLLGSCRKLLTGAASKMVVKIGTHNGTFHCDEVLACTMLKYLPRYKDAEIVRTRDQKLLDGCDVVVDVGGVFDPTAHRYDHHQSGFSHSVSTLLPGKRWVTKLSSAGLVYVHFGKEVISEILQSKDEKLIERLFDKVYENFVEEVDAVDNGIPTHDGAPRYFVSTTIGSRVANLRPSWNDEDKDYDAGFRKAMQMVGAEFEDRIRFYADAWWPARSIVARAIEKRFETSPSGRIVVFGDGGCPYKEHLYQLEEELGIQGQILFALFEDETSGSWRVGTVPEHPKSFVCRRTLKDEWKAMRGDELSAKSGIDGCVFVHASGFIGGNANREGALKMALASLDSDDLPNAN